MGKKLRRELIWIAVFFALTCAAGWGLSRYMAHVCASAKLRTR